VRFVEGPFATGILRVQQGIDAEALYPVPEPEDVQVTVEKTMNLDLARASYRGVTVELLGDHELERIARAFVVARAARAT
jgi:hypothetical protein